jgi:hypothetical protein
MTNKIIYALLLLIVAGVIVVYWLQFGFTTIIIRDGLYMSTVFMAVAGGGYAIHTYGFKNARSLTLLFLTAAVGCLLIGESIFEYHFLVLKHDIPFPSIGDFFYLSSYPLLFAGLFNEIRLADVNWRKLNKGIWLLLVIVSLALTFVVYKWGIVTGYNAEDTLFTNTISMSYGVGDLFLIIVNLFLLVLVREYRGGRFARIWLIMLLGFVFLLTGDILQEFYRTEYHNEVWFWKCLFDSLGMACYLCFATALFEFGFSIKDALKQAGLVIPAK